MQDIICNFKCVLEADLLIRYILQALVRNNDQGVNIFLELINACVCLFHALLAFKTKRSGNNADSQNAHFPCDLCDNRCTAGTRAAAHACGNEHHIGTTQCLRDIILCFIHGALTDFRVAACAQTLCQLFANLDFRCGFGFRQSLSVCIDGNEFHPIQAVFNHSIYCVVAAAANTDYFNLRHITHRDI